MFSQDKLDFVWELVKDRKSLFAGKKFGLMKVDFSMSDSDFELSYGIKTKSQIISVAESVEEVVKELSDAYITTHHLSCAAPSTGFGEDTALCIHYRKPPFYENSHCIALPGVNYVTKKSHSK